MDRRSFIRLAASTAAAVELRPLFCLARPNSSIVSFITDSSFLKSSNTGTARLSIMLNTALKNLTSADDADEAWRALFDPGDTVGIKVNCMAGRSLSPNTELVAAIARSLLKIGIPRDRIIVWDRNKRDLRGAGFRVEGKNGLYRCFGTDSAGFDDKLYENGSVGSLISSIITRMCTAVINVPVLKDHGITGVSLSMKNYFGAIHNPNKYHPGGGSPYIADLNALNIIRSKERLIICDCLQAQYHAGPAYAPKWNLPLGGLLLSRDPVALDTTGLGIIARIRAEKGLPSLEEEKRMPRYIAYAAEKYELGNASPELIDVIEDEM